MIFIQSILFLLFLPLLGKAEANLRMDILAGAYFQGVNTSALNPDNRIFFAPKQNNDLEFRPFIKDSFSQIKTSFYLTPRVNATATTYPHNLTQDQTLQLSDRYFNEANVKTDFSDSLQIAVGKINFLWGQSEVISPTQFLFQDTVFKTEPFAEYAGIEMIKAQWLFSSNWAFVQMIELYPWTGLQHFENPDYLPRTFRNSVLSRIEYNSDQGSAQVGLVAGQQTIFNTRNLAGLNFFWSYSDLAQIYGDTIAQQGSDQLSWNGNETPSLKYTNSANIFQLLAVGHRLSFLENYEWHIEYLQNDFAPSSSERQNAVQRIKNQDPASLIFIRAFAVPLAPLPGRAFLYNSVKSLGDQRWSLRHLYSFGDATQILSLTFESGLTDHLSYSLAFNQSFGQNDGELTGQQQQYGSAFLKYSF